ncbi:aldehyde dehydrogenase family protein [Nonomuraea spiralis]|uniref:Aldehyde dehydrogenase family protein n=1 Tax=Nonomuraea spiralis TaxID=46182 RepID=A0ABV5IT35_9ACTN|nr:aldehyde dehydrogenase family protein [Nonomuraea spiralis]GGT17006.1 aldehyde dehydrogenase [Nonomuraea spiralis]
MTYQVRDPRTGLLERELRPPSPAELAETAAGLRAAQPAWAALTAEARAAALLAWRKEISAAESILVSALTADTGRYAESVMEVRSVLGMLERWAGQAPKLLATSPGPATTVPGVEVCQSLVPYQLTGVISPWNFPLLLGLIDAIPALAAGSAVIVKPSEVTPRFIGPVMDTVQRVPLLAKTLAIVEGDGATGAELIELVDVLAFTGSVPTGRAVGAAAAEAFIPAFLELGGKDPAIVLAGSDLERASSAILWGATANAGQSCLSIERVYVEEPAYERFVDLLTAKAERLRLARPGPADGQIGPLIDPAQALIIERHLADAFAKGAVARCGGAVETLDGGLWCKPTVLIEVDHGMLVMTEETFGPIVPVMPASDARHAVELANDSAFGLSAAVFGPDLEAARTVAARLQAGAVSVNDAALTAFVHEGTKNSFKLSGLGGSRMGPASLFRFVRHQAHLVNRSPAHAPWWH